MNSKDFSSRIRCLMGAAVIGLSISGNAAAAPSAEGVMEAGERAASLARYWTAERRARAIPRDLVVDARGLGYLRTPDGGLAPYGHEVAAEAATKGGMRPMARPTNGGGNDTREPVITDMSPASGETIGTDHRFSARVVDDSSGVKAVTFELSGPGTRLSVRAQQTADVWSADVSGLTGGAWSWSVVATDGARKGGNTATEGPVDFAVLGSGPANPVIANAPWTGGGPVQSAVGRIFFEMPNNRKRTGPWWAYVCSGAVVEDATSGRSIILTAAHCVYDDANKAFARNVIFIPNQAQTTGAGTDWECGNDPLGCWAPGFGVVDENWADRTFPDNIQWDYAYYVVPDTGAHEAAATVSVDEALDVAAGALTIDFNAPNHDESGDADYTHGMGYSYSEDPNFMFCAEDMAQQPDYDVNWWLANCELTGGSSGGPWIQPLVSGGGDIVSVNSWGYTGYPGMAGPKLDAYTASCLFSEAKETGFDELPSANDGDAGVIVPAECVMN